MSGPDWVPCAAIVVISVPQASLRENLRETKPVKQKLNQGDPRDRKPVGYNRLGFLIGFDVVYPWSLTMKLLSVSTLKSL